MDLTGVDWMIIGALTNPLILPEPAWVEVLLEEASRRNTSVFLKKSLGWHKEVHQWPEEKRTTIEEELSKREL